MDNDAKPIEDFIQAGLAQRFYKVFVIPLLFYNGPDQKTVATQMLKQKGLPQYPFAVAKTTEWSVTEQSFKPNTLLRRGIKSRSSDDYILAYELNLIPVTTKYDVTFYVQGYKELQALAKEWLMASVRNNLKFSVRYAVLDTDINISIGRNIQVPERSGGTDEVKEYTTTIDMTVQGYMSDPLKTSQAATQLELDIQLLDALGVPGGQVTLFSADWPSKPCDTCTGGDVVIIEKDANFVYARNDAASIWGITHGLNKFPSVTVVDSFGNMVEGTVNFPSLNQVIIQFSTPQTGRAFLN